MLTWNPPGYWRAVMKVSYRKLWKLPIDRDMSRTELRLRAGISSVSPAKLGKSEGVTANVLVKICSALDCNIGGIMDVVSERGKYARKTYFVPGGGGAAGEKLRRERKSA